MCDCVCVVCVCDLLCAMLRDGVSVCWVVGWCVGVWCVVFGIGGGVEVHVCVRGYAVS